MHEVTPKVVAIAVSTVMITCNTLLQICLLSLFIVCLFLVKYVVLQARKRRVTADNPSFSLRYKDTAPETACQVFGGGILKDYTVCVKGVFGYSGIQLFTWAGGGENNSLVVIIYKYYYYKKFSYPLLRFYFTEYLNTLNTP